MTPTRTSALIQPPVVLIYIKATTVGDGLLLQAFFDALLSSSIRVFTEIGS